MAQGSEFPLRKPPGFHYDFFLLGITTFIAGLLGIPAPNGLIPQAPIHTTSLVILGRPSKDEEYRGDTEEGTAVPSGSATPGRVARSAIDEIESEEKQAETDIMERATQAWREVPIAVVEQRVSNLAQGALCLVLLTGPFLHVLHLIPRGVSVLSR